MKRSGRDPRDAIRKVIRLHALTVDAIAQRIGMHKTQVQLHLKEIQGELLITGNPRRYRLSAIAQPDPEPGEFRVAGTIVHGRGSVWNSGRA